MVTSKFWLRRSAYSHPTMMKTRKLDSRPTTARDIQTLSAYVRACARVDIQHEFLMKSDGECGYDQAPQDGLVKHECVEAKDKFLYSESVEARDDGSLRSHQTWEFHDSPKFEQKIYERNADGTQIRYATQDEQISISKDPASGAIMVGSSQWDSESESASRTLYLGEETSTSVVPWNNETRAQLLGKFDKTYAWMRHQDRDLLHQNPEEVLLDHTLENALLTTHPGSPLKRGDVRYLGYAREGGEVFLQAKRTFRDGEERTEVYARSADGSEYFIRDLSGQSTHLSIDTERKQVTLTRHSEPQDG